MKVFRHWWTVYNQFFSAQAEPDVPASVTVSLNFTPAPAIVQAAPAAGPAAVLAAEPDPIITPDPSDDDGSPPDSPASNNDNTHSDSSNKNVEADTIKSPPLNHSSTGAIDHETTETPKQLTTPQNLLPRLHHVYYGATHIKGEARVPIRKRFQQISTIRSGLTPSREQKCPSILKSLERHRQQPVTLL